MPYDMYEAEDGQTGGGAQVVGPNRTVGDLAGEASGRKAVTLNSTGSYVQWTTRASTNTLVARFSIPDGTHQLDQRLRQRHAQQDPAADLEVRLALRQRDRAAELAAPARGTSTTRRTSCSTGSFPAGSTIKLQKDAATRGNIAIDFINTEQVAPIANPDPATYVGAGRLRPAGRCRTRWTRPGRTPRKVGVYLPAGDYQTVEQVPGVRQGAPGRRRRPLVHPVLHAADADRDRRRLPGRRHRQRLDVRRTSRSSATTRSASTAPARCSTSPTSPTSRSTTSGPSTWCASTGAPTPTT